MCHVHDDEVQATEAAFGERVRTARTAKGLTQRQLAESVGLDASAVSRLEAGTRAVRLGESTLIAKALQIPLQELADPASSPRKQFDSTLRRAGDRQDAARNALVEMAYHYVTALHLFEHHPEILAEYVFGIGRAPVGAEATRQTLWKALAIAAAQSAESFKPLASFDLGEDEFNSLLEIINSSIRNLVAREEVGKDADT